MSQIGIDIEEISRFRLDKKSSFLNKVFSNTYISLYCQDDVINTYLKNNKSAFDINPTFPDKIVYCGVSCCYLNELSDIPLIKYKEMFNDIPKVIIYKEYLYITSSSLYKCYDIENVLKASLMINDTNSENVFIQKHEVDFLVQWDAEKYRQNI
jgi:hypothetical protein